MGNNEITVDVCSSLASDQKNKQLFELLLGLFEHATE